MKLENLSIARFYLDIYFWKLFLSIIYMMLLYIKTKLRLYLSLVGNKYMHQLLYYFRRSPLSLFFLFTSINLIVKKRFSCPVVSQFLEGVANIL